MHCSGPDRDFLSRIRNLQHPDPKKIFVNLAFVVQVTLAKSGLVSPKATDVYACLLFSYFKENFRVIKIVVCTI